ncbi:hypothetical protein [Nocardioides sp.]|uniref:hypothetical protein n=1 Tax=Nocardioides sp. TaxID=35761 RepID=UPI0039E59810
MRQHLPGAARSLTGATRLLIAAAVAAVIVATALVLGLLHTTPIAAEESAAATTDTLAELPSAKPAELGQPRDPLSIEEYGYAEALAKAALPADATDVAGASGGELLSIDLASMDATTTDRLVAVTYYDYTAGETVVVTVDLYAGTTTGTATSAKLQPPPSPAETYAATDLLIHAQQGKRLATEYAAITGTPISAEAVTATAGSYYDTLPTKVDDDCGEHRCVELQLQEPSGKYLSSIDYVVDLTTKSVIVLNDRTAVSTLSGGKEN